MNLISAVPSHSADLVLRCPHMLEIFILFSCMVKPSKKGQIRMVHSDVCIHLAMICSM